MLLQLTRATHGRCGDAQHHRGHMFLYETIKERFVPVVPVLLSNSLAPPGEAVDTDRAISTPCIGRVG